MNQSNSSKQVLLSVIGVAILVVAVVGVSFAFFNYTRSGQVNTVETGKIYFNSEQNQAIRIENFFPTIPNGTPSNNTSTAVISITAYTSWEDGIDYRISASEVSNDYNIANVPVSVLVTPSASLNVGAANTDTKVLSNGYATAATLPNGGGELMTGHIKGDGNTVTGTVTVEASISNEIAITDTLVGEEASTAYVNGTTGQSGWVGQRTRMTTTQWNALKEHPLTFRLKVEARETGGTYVS